MEERIIVSNVRRRGRTNSTCKGRQTGNARDTYRDNVLNLVVVIDLWVEGKMGQERMASFRHQDVHNDACRVRMRRPSYSSPPPM